jgi:NAD(P)-dependent dehydrogenase (short-subunit alcohol dehydrogenase family)
MFFSVIDKTIKSNEPKVVLITGASSGIGRVTAELLAWQGFRVFGTSRNPEKTAPASFPMLPLDVCSPESIPACLTGVVEQAGYPDILINNAGYMLVGALEETSPEEAKAEFETNFFGLCRVTAAVLPAMRERRFGQIINISSIAGLLGSPYHGYYSASKHAVEGYTESLRYELKPFNIAVSLVECGWIKTALGENMRQVSQALPDYSRRRSKALAVIERKISHGPEPEIVARLVARIVKSKSPRLAYRVGREGVWLPRFRKLSPQIFEAGVYRYFEFEKAD